MSGYVNTALFATYAIVNVLSVALLKFNLARAAASLRVDPDWAALSATGVGGTLYIGSFVLWLVLLARLELTLAYPIAVGLTLAGTSVVGVYVLGEALSLGRIIGLLLILAGVIAVSRS